MLAGPRPLRHFLSSSDNFSHYFILLYILYSIILSPLLAKKNKIFSKKFFLNFFTLSSWQLKPEGLEFYLLGLFNERSELNNPLYYIGIQNLNKLCISGIQNLNTPTYKI